MDSYEVTHKFLRLFLFSFSFSNPGPLLNVTAHSLVWAEYEISRTHVYRSSWPVPPLIGLFGKLKKKNKPQCLWLEIHYLCRGDRRPTVSHIRTYSTSVQALCVELVTVVSTAGMRCNAWRAGNKVCRQLLVASSWKIWADGISQRAKCYGVQRHWRSYRLAIPPMGSDRDS